MRFLKYIFIFFLLILLNSTLLNIVSVFGIKPNLFLIFLFFICIQEGSFVGVLTGFIIGLSVDVYTPQHIGTGSFIKSILGYFLGFFDHKVIRLEDRYKVLILFAATLIHEIVVLLFRSESSETIFTLLFTFILPSSLYTSLMGAIFFMFLSRFKR